MGMFEKVLVCLDGSPLAEEMLPRIAGEAGHLGKVILVRVMATPEFTLPFGVPGETMAPVSLNPRLQRYEKELEEAPGYLEEKARPLREKGLDVETVVLQGGPAEAIIGYAADNGVTLIALGTHGHSGFRDVTIGGTAEHILRHSGLPVLLVSPRKHSK
jgi:nucleotide-binding universal stress UspA family protein